MPGPAECCLQLGEFGHQRGQPGGVQLGDLAAQGTGLGGELLGALEQRFDRAVRTEQRLEIPGDIAGVQIGGAQVIGGGAHREPGCQTFAGTERADPAPAGGGLRGVACSSVNQVKSRLAALALLDRALANVTDDEIERLVDALGPELRARRTPS